MENDVNGDVIGPVTEPNAVTPSPTSVLAGDSVQVTVGLTRTATSIIVPLTYSALDSQGQPVDSSTVLSSPPSSITIVSAISGTITVTTLSTSPAAVVTVTAIGTTQSPTGTFTITT